MHNCVKLYKKKIMTKSELNASNLPEAPGVYFFRDKEDNILYIGKATNLKDRTKSYFSKDLTETRGLKIVNMVWLLIMSLIK